MHHLSLFAVCSALKQELLVECVSRIHTSKIHVMVLCHDNAILQRNSFPELKTKSRKILYKTRYLYDVCLREKCPHFCFFPSNLQ